MTQPSLFDVPDQPPESVRGPRRMARRTDPISSHLAAAEAVESGAVNAQCVAVLAAMRGQAWQTSDEIAYRAGLDRHAAARRLPELERNGQVVRGPMRKSAVGKRPGVTWRTVEG